MAGDAEAVGPVALLDAAHVELEPRRALDAVAAGLPIEAAERALGDQGLGRVAVIFRRVLFVWWE
jgi:hypothetical protein